MAETPVEPRFKTYWLVLASAAHILRPTGSNDHKSSFLLSYLLNPLVLNPCDDKNQLEIWPTPQLSHPHLRLSAYEPFVNICGDSCHFMTLTPKGTRVRVDTEKSPRSNSGYSKTRV
ncbi:rCG57307, partial [Rattus norvegicus]